MPTAPLAEAEPTSGTPQAPQNQVAEATQTEGELAVTWDPPDNDDRSAVTGYSVEWRLSADHWGGDGVSVIRTDETSHTISGLTQASPYAVRVRALNQPGAGAATGDVLASPTGAAPLLAEFTDIPASRAGSDPFTVRVAFSEDIANGYIQMRDRAIEVTGGMVLTASRVERRNDLWEITILPHSTDHVTVVVATPTDCSTWGHICTASEKKLSNRLQLTVPGS